MPPTLHLICGKIAAGKSTLAQQLATHPATVLIREDKWLSQLYPDQLRSLQDYVRCSTLLRSAIDPHIQELLRAGLSVVLDFPANTVNSRKWMRGIFEATGAAHQLHYLDVPNSECIRRLRLRNTEGTHEFSATDADFEEFTRYFVPPSPEEGFNVVIAGGSSGA